LLNGAREGTRRMEALKPKRHRGYPVSIGRIILWRYSRFFGLYLYPQHVA
jgi:hypothetical protein